MQYGIKMRWLVLLVVALWGLVGAQRVTSLDPRAVGAVVLLGVLFNTVAALLARRGFTMSLTLPSLLVDLLIIAYAVQHSGGLESPLFFLYVVPLFAAAMMYRLVGFVGVLALTMLVHVVTASPDTFVSGGARAYLLFQCLFFALVGLLLLRLTGDRVLTETELAGMEQVGRTLGNRTDRLTTVPEVLRTAGETAGAELMAVYQYDRGEGRFVPWSPAGDDIPELGPEARAAADRAVQTNETQVVQWTREPLGALETPAMIACVPIGPAEAPAGVLVAATADRLRLFTSQAITFLKLIAGEMALLFRESALEDSLTVTQRTIATLLAHLDSAVLVADARGNVLAVNKAAATLMNLEQDAVLGKPLAAAVAQPEVTSLLARVVDKGQSVNEEVRLGGGQDLTIRVDASPIEDARKALLGYVAVFTNITERRRLESLKSEFVAALSHELRTPLTSIKAYTATLLRDTDFDEETRREFLSVINTQCDRLTALINDLLDVSNIDSGKSLELNWAEVGLEELVQEEVGRQRRLTDRHTFVVDIAPDAARMWADPHRLRQILTNLLSNATKYSPDGGEILVRAVADSEWTRIDVVDHGMGIAPQYHQTIFDRFFQVDGSTTRRVGGSGTGLYLVKHLAEAHGGSVSVESVPGEGSAFTVRLPRTPPKRTG